MDDDYKDSISNQESNPGTLNLEARNINLCTN